MFHQTIGGLRFKQVYLVALFALAFFGRSFRISQVPPGLEIDETSIGYNAYSLLKTGKDEHGKFLPLYFKAFGEYKLPAYIYGAALSIRLFGPTELAVRLPAVISGSLTVILFYWLLTILFPDNRKLQFLAPLLLAINPWHLHFSRIAFETTLGLFFFTSATLSFFLFINKKLNFFLPLTLFLFILSTFTYNIFRLLSPIMAIFLFATNFSQIKGKTSRLIKSITGLILAAWLTIFISGIFLPFGLASARGTLIWSSSVNQAKILELRSYFINLPVPIVKLLFNRYILTFWEYLNNIANYLSGSFFFTAGSPHGNHGIGNAGNFYLFELPLVITGMIFTPRLLNGKIKLMFVWLTLTVLVASLTRETPQATRSLPLTIPFSFFSAAGLIFIKSQVSAIKSQTKKIFLAGTLILFMTYNLIYYFTSYYFRFPIVYAKAYRSADKPLAEYLRKVYGQYDQILIDTSAGVLYTSLLFYQQFPPEDFQRSAVRKPPDSEGYEEVISFGKYQIKKIDWTKDLADGKTLIVTTPEHPPPNLQITKTFFYPQKPVSIAVKQEILRYPVTETAYYVTVNSDHSTD